MYRNTLKSKLMVNASNIPGWRTNRHIVVIESDDWGSIRMSSSDAFQRMLKAGMREYTNHYNTNDSLESNGDMERMFETLTSFKDKNGNHPVITGVNVVANPIFDKIRESDFSQYFYEPYTETLKRYPKHNKVYEYWKEGIRNRLMVPIFHGREHLNVQRWLRALQTGHRSTLLAFDCGVTGIYNGIDGEPIPEFQAAFDIDTSDDIPYLRTVLETGLDLFEELYGYRSSYFVPTNGPFNNTLESILNSKEVKYINSGKIQLEPLGNGKYRKNYRYLGKKNSLGQIYLTRNCFFEPSSTESPRSRDWIDTCLHEIDIAFRWHKPATISSHRVNYIGYLHPENRDQSHRKLSELLWRMLKRWPDIEFMTSMELGDLITGK